MQVDLLVFVDVGPSLPANSEAPEAMERGGIRGDELPHPGGQVKAGVVPDQRDRIAELDAGTYQEVAEVPSVEALQLALAPSVLADA